MDIAVGTSGYNYPEWKGTFYPDPFPASKMFAYYAERFRTVEINYTFYRMPTPKLLPLVWLVILSFMYMAYTSVRLDRL